MKIVPSISNTLHITIIQDYNYPMKLVINLLCLKGELLLTSLIFITRSSGKYRLPLNVGWKCHFQFSQLSQLHEWNFFQLSEWKNYCHFLWLSIYLLLLLLLTDYKIFSARIISKSNFFSAEKHILTTTCCWNIIEWMFPRASKYSSL